ncbi:MAG: tetratricopeptide repeat protein [candidate division Zixibacteria bacterium]|nr:tetratricopeptide repeat protein [candidate division Zixibacteria bacterium]
MTGKRNSTNSPARRPEGVKWPMIIFAAAFLIRLIYLLQYRSNPSFNFPMVDELWHFNWASEIIGGKFWGSEAYFRGPLYPYFLAVLLKITGSSIFWSRLLQCLLPSFSAVLIYLLGKRAFSKKAGIIAGLAFAAYGTMIFYDTMFMLEALFITLALLSVYLMLLYKGERKPRQWLGTGIIFGLAAITRPNILLLAPLFLIWIYLGFASIRDFKKRLLIPFIYLAGLLIPVLSVTLRNYLVTGEAILVSSQGGVNFYLGNNRDAEGLTMLMPEVKLDESLPWNQFTAATRRAAEKETGKKLTAGEESSFWTDKALKFIGSNPGRFLALTFRKIIYFLVGFENSDNGDIYFSRNYSSLFSLLLWKKLIYFPFGLLLPLAVAGLAASWKRRRELSLFYLFIIGYLPTVILFLVTARHRLPVIPFLLLFAAAGTLEIYGDIKEKDWSRVRIYGAIFLILLIFSNRTYFDIGFENKAQIHFNLGLTYERQGNLMMAEKEYRAALESDPYSPTMLNNLGFVQYRLGQYNAALATFNKAIQYDPNFAQAYNNIGLIYESQNDPAQAENHYKKAINLNPELVQGYINLGDLYLAGNDLVKSELYYLQAKQVAPSRKEPLFKLGALYGRMKDFSRAQEMFQSGGKLGEPGAIDCINCGNIYYATRQPAKAIELYRRGIAMDSSSAQAYFNLAATFQSFGYPPDSAKYYLRKLLLINPQFEPARDLLKRIENQ